MALARTSPPCSFRSLQGVLALGLGVLSGNSPAADLPPPQSGIIDKQLQKAWADNKITPANVSSDLAYMRRLFIDVLGRIPTAEEVSDFERDQAAGKRARLIARILNLPPNKPSDLYKLRDSDGNEIVFDYQAEFARHWAEVWTVWLMSRTGVHEVYRAQMELWLEKAFLNDMPFDQMVRELLTAKGKSNVNNAVNFIAQQLGNPTSPDRRISDGPFEAFPITARVTQLFAGIQARCTQCHDHPFNPEWGQEMFWGVNLFFRTTSRDRTPAPPVGIGRQKKWLMALPVTLDDDARLNPTMRYCYERRPFTAIKPQFLPDLADLEKEKSERVKKPIPAGNVKSRREVLADYVIAHDNFAIALVNRMWGQFFGRGLNEQPAVDDFGGHNKIVYPVILQSLGAEFVKHKYHFKRLIEWICLSEAYNLSCVAPSKEMSKPEKDVYFVRMPLKPMSPEVLFRSLGTATGADARADGQARKAARETWMNKLVQDLGDDAGNELNFSGDIVEALLVMNGKETNEEISRPDGLVARTIARASKLQNADDYIIDHLYLTALGRHPSSHPIETVDPKTKQVVKMSEIEFVKKHLDDAMKHAANGDKKASDSAYQSFFEDLFWTLLNTNEFILNH